MGKKTKNPASGGGSRRQKFWCYYCGAESKDEGTLIQHQAAKHFCCPFCDVGAFGRLCQSLSGLVSHVRRSHRKELDKVPGAMPGRESVETDVYGMSGIPANVLEAARQNEPDDDEEDFPAPVRSSQPAPVPQASSGCGGGSDGPGVDSITQALAGAASDSTSPMAKALLAAVATNSPATAGDTDNIIKAVLRAATTPKNQNGGGGGPPQMSMPSAAPPSGGSIRPSEGMMGVGGLLGAQMAKASAMTGQMGGLLGAANQREMQRPADPAPGYSSLGLPQPPGGGGGFGGSSMPLSLPPANFGMSSSTALATTTSNKEEKPPPFPTRAEFRKAVQEEELKAQLGRFRPGAKIEIKGLVNNGKLNGSQGKVVSIMTDILGTVKVQLADSGKQFCVRPDNMRIIDYSGEHMGGDTSDNKRKRSGSKSRSRSRNRSASPPKRKRKSRWEPEGPAERMKQRLAMETIDLTKCKPSMCMTFTEGLCTKGEACAGAHQLRELAPGGFKPKLCPSYNAGVCPRGDVCVYAHDPKELPPNFKLSLCANFQGGHCRKQGICNFAHGHDELKYYQELLAPSIGGPSALPGLGGMPALGNAAPTPPVGGNAQPQGLGFLAQQFAAAKAGQIGGAPGQMALTNAPQPNAGMGGLSRAGATWGGAQTNNMGGCGGCGGCGGGGGFPGGGGCGGGFPGGGGFPPPPAANAPPAAKMPGLFPPPGGCGGSGMMTKMGGAPPMGLPPLSQALGSFGGMSKSGGAPPMDLTGGPPAPMPVPAKQKCTLWEMGGCSLGKNCPLEHVGRGF